jgi:hypothetical protein
MVGVTLFLLLLATWLAHTRSKVVPVAPRGR